MKLLKRILAVMMCVAICFAFTACDDGDEGPVDQNTIKTEGSLVLTYKENKIVKDSDGNDAMMIKFSIKNETNKDFNIKSNVIFAAKQGEETLARAILIDKVDETQDFIDSTVTNGSTVETVVFFVLKDKTTPVKFTMTPKVGVEKAAVEQEIALS